MNGRVFILGITFGYSLAQVVTRLKDVIEIEQIAQKFREELDNWGQRG